MGSQIKKLFSPAQRTVLSIFVTIKFYKMRSAISFFIRTCQDNIKYPSFSPAIAIVMGRNRGTEWEPGIQAVHIRTNTPSPADNIIDLAFLCIRHARNH